MTTDISAQVALRHPMEPRNALELRKAQALTPYNSQVWEAQLLESGLYKKYLLLPQNLRTGFLINIPNITTTQTPPNKSTISEFQDQFDKIVSLELQKHVTSDHSLARS
jgi:hypothetical protein